MPKGTFIPAQMGGGELNNLNNSLVVVEYSDDRRPDLRSQMQS